MVDDYAWDSVLRPKKCLLAVNRKLRNIVAKFARQFLKFIACEWALGFGWQAHDCKVPCSLVIRSSVGFPKSDLLQIE